MTDCMFERLAAMTTADVAATDADRDREVARHMAEVSRDLAFAAEQEAKAQHKDAALWGMVARGEIARSDRDRAYNDPAIILVQRKYVRFLAREDEEGELTFYPSGKEVDWSYGD